jgi:hypothetical protein
LIAAEFTGTLGVILFDIDWDTAASRQCSAASCASFQNAIFRRRLVEARAFAAASEQVAHTRPEHSPRWGTNAKQGIASFVLTIAYLVWLSLAPGPAMRKAAGMPVT